MKFVRFVSFFMTLFIITSSLTVAVTATSNNNKAILLADEVTIQEGESIEFSLHGITEGNYNLKYDYLAESKEVVIDILVNEKSIIPENQECVLYQAWENSTTQKEQDNQGNDIRPVQQKSKSFLSSYLMLTATDLSEKAQISVDRTSKSLKIRSCAGKCVLKNIKLAPVESDISYQEYRESHSVNGNAYYKKYQAEDASIKSSSALYATYDRNSYHVEPNDPQRVRLNIIGGSNYAQQGQFLVWDIVVPEDGLYTLTFKYRQNIKRGFDSARRLWIDGEIPFSEAYTLYFPYGTDWQILSLGGDKPYEFYLTKGKHSIMLEAVNGKTGPVLTRLSGVVMRMNEIYRKIIMVTSVSPDPLRDYNLDKEIPELIPELTELRFDLQNCITELESIADGEGSESAFMLRTLDLIDGFIDDPYNIQDGISSFSSSASSIAQFVITGQNQPLELDYFIVSGTERNLGESEKFSFWKSLIFRIKRFLSSFIVNYNSIGNVYTDEEVQPLKVWAAVSDMATSGIAVGRDQINILKNLIDRRFYEEYNIPVNISLVGSNDMLMQAVMAGTGPDVSIFTPTAMPVNFALREAVVNLLELNGIEDKINRFFPSALKGFYLEDGLYALPDTQIFDVMFYRTDIFEELGLVPPETWEEFYSTVAFLQKRNLLTGLAENNKSFEMLLLQNNASLYNEDVSKIMLSESNAVESMKTWTKLYTQLGMPLRFNALNRFRTGEMPMLITSYTFYNQLSAGAPELDGLWKMTLIPGTENNGNIVHTESCVTTGSIIIKNTKNLDSAYLFIDWWTSAETQLAYADEVEATLGVASRHSTANLNAFLEASFEYEYKQPIFNQWQSVDDFPQSPASYYVTRSITNAFRKIVMKNANPRDTINRYARDMQQELDRKRKEFNLEG